MDNTHKSQTFSYVKVAIMSAVKVLGNVSITDDL
jgi:hypothetical protein